MKRILLLIAFLPLFVNAGLFYASPTGTGNGALFTPFGLQTALNSPSVHAGDTLYLLAGTYKGNYTSSLTGTITQPILVRNNPGDRVVLDGTRLGQTVKDIPVLKVNGAFTWYWGLEVTNSEDARTGSFSGPDRRGMGIEVFGIGVKVINCIIYDTGQGLDAWTPAANSEYYGNVIFNNGWSSTSGMTGHGIYTQNDTGSKSYIDNIVLNNFGVGMKIYAESGATNNFYLEGNVNFNDRWIMGGMAPVKNLELNANYAYKDAPEFGYTSKLNDGLILRNNYFSIGAHLYWWKNVNIKNNTIFYYTGKSTPYDIIFDGPVGPPDLTTLISDSNTYAWSTTLSTNSFYFYWNNSAVATGQPGKSGQIFFPAWQGLGKDIHSTFNLYPPNGNAIILSGKKIFVRKNKYDINKSNIIIYNWDKSSTVTISSGLSVGDSFELRNVQNYFGDVITGVATGDSLTVPMTGHTVAKPVGWGLEIAPSTFPEFGVFVLTRTAGPLQVDTCSNIDSLISLVSIMQGQMIGLQNSVDSIITNYNSRITTLEAQLSTLKTRVDSLKATTTIY